MSNLEKRIKNFGIELGEFLPVDFVEYMINENIDLILGKEIDFVDNYNCEETLCIHQVYGFKDEQEDIIENYKYELDENIISEIIPIAEDEGGNFICISARRKDSGKIYFVDHEIGAKNMEKLPLIANSFTEFLSKLRERK